MVRKNVEGCQNSKFNIMQKCWLCDDVHVCRRTGTSLTFVTRGDWAKAKDLIDILVEANQVYTSTA